MDTNTVIEGTVKFRDGKKWKSRWCVVRKLSPVADCLHLQLYRDSKERYKQGQTKASLSLENFLGIQSGFTLDKESNTLAVICQEVIVVLAFDTREHLMQWQIKVSANLGEGDQFLVQISSAPPRAKLSPGPARLLIQEFQFCLTVGVPPRLIAFWQIRQLRRFGVVEGKFCFEGGSRCGRGEGLYVLVSEKPEELRRAFDLAADGKLFTRKHPLTRNSSVMDRSRKHHTFRPDSRLSNVSSLDSTTLDSPESYDTSKTSCCSCSHSREDLMSPSPSQHPLADLANYMVSSESHRFDLKSLWNSGSSDKTLGRCTSCISKIGGMSRSSTLSNTPCSRFPAWTMDRPKSCGSQKMTCSSVSLSSHSSQGSCCPSADYHQRYSAISNCSSVCSTNGNMKVSSPVECSHTPPSRPPKPAHLSFQRMQLRSTAEAPKCSTPFMSPMQSPMCCCNKKTISFQSPFGNYDVPKSLNSTHCHLKLDLKDSPINTRLQPQLTPDEFYDTPRKIINNLSSGEYGNYDVPPPALPVINNSSQDILHTSEKRGAPDGTESSSIAEESVPEFLKDGYSQAISMHHINKVKLTGKGKMPVMSPCGKIIEKPELSYEEKLDNLLENINTDSENVILANYANISVKDNQSDSLLNVSSTMCEKTGNNYENLNLLQSLQNYENLNCILPKQCNVINNSSIFSEINVSNISSKETNIDDPDGNQNSNICDKGAPLCCSNCGTLCSKSLKSTTEQSLVNNNSEIEQTIENVTSIAQERSEMKTCGTISSRGQQSNTFIDNKCNSTSCLHEITLDPISTQEVSDKNKKGATTSTVSSCSVTSSPALRRPDRQCSIERILSSKLQNLRTRSNSADSTRLHIDDQSGHDTISTDSHGRSHLSSSDSLCAIEKLEEGTEIIEKDRCDVPELQVVPLVISESTDFQETIETSPKRTKYFDLIGARRSASVPNKFFCNRDSSSSNDSGVSTGSLSFRHYGPEFLEFEMPLTTSMSSKRHHIAMVNSTHVNNEEKLNVLPKRSKSVDPLRDLTFTFDFRERETNGKSTSAEAEVPVFLQESKIKDFLSPQKPSGATDSRSTSSDTSDMSDYFETLSFSSFSSLDVPECFRYGRPSASTMKPRSGKEYHKIDRLLLDQDGKQ